MPEDSNVTHEELASPAAVVRVRPQDELGVLLSKLRQEKSDTIRLVIPERSVIAQGSIGLKVLADELEKLHKHIEVATESTQVQVLARRAGLNLVSGTGAAVVHGFIPGQDVADQPAVEPAMAAEETAVSDPIVAPTPKNRAGWFNRLPVSKTSIIVIVAFLIVLLAGGWLATYYLPQATVTVYTEQRTLDRDLSVTADPNASKADVQQLIVPAEEVEVTTSITRNFDATGKKDIGEKATGSVTLYNKTSSAQVLPAGTLLSANQLKFSLNTAVTVPAATTAVTPDPDTEGTITTVTPGTIAGSITASAIGSDYNLPSKTQFSVGTKSVSDLSAKNMDAALSGGKKESVKVVSSEDRSTASEELVQAAKTQSLADLKDQLGSDDTLLEEAIQYKTISTTFTHAVNEETDQFSATIKQTGQGLKISTKDLNAMLNTAVEEKVPDGYELDADESTIDHRVLRVNDDGSVDLVSTFKTLILPTVDVESMKKAIKGKSPQAVEEYLKGQPNLSGYDITLTPKLPGPFYKLPSIDSHIQIKVSVKS